MKVTEDVAGHCPPLAGGRGVERHKQESWHTYNLNIYVFVQTITHYAMNGVPDVGFKMKTRMPFIPLRRGTGGGLGILYAIHRITRLNKMKIPIQLLSTQYNPKEIEDKWYRFWEEKGVFHSIPDSSKKPYPIVIPPPNVTGVLHMGHALNNIIQDIVIQGMS